MEEHAVNINLPRSEQIRLLSGRLRELRPAIAEARRIERRLSALRAGDERIPRPRKRYSPEHRVLQLVALLYGEPGLRRADVARALDLTRGRAGQIVELAISAGDVEDHGANGLTLTRQGDRRAKGIDPEQPDVLVSTNAVSVGERAAGGDEGSDH